MKKSGFTLVELLAVITIIGILSIIIVPKVLDMMGSNKSKLYDDQISRIYEAANLYVTNETYNVDFSSGTASVTLGDLIDSGYLESKIINPKTNEQFGTGMTVTIVRGVSGEFTFSLEEAVETNFAIIPFDYETGVSELVFGGQTTDDAYQSLSLGFNVLMGGNSYSTIYVSSNGCITFASASNCGSSRDIFTEGYDVPIVAAYWTDLYFDRNVTPSSGIYYTIGNEAGINYVVIEYRSVFHYNDSSKSLSTASNFEIKLYANGIAKVYYDSVNFHSASYANGSGASIGYNLNSTNYIQYSYDSPSLTTPMGIAYYPGGDNH